ncbi:MAG: hypothetical protein M3134_07585 [Actinomycetota bacterium]|nr:hypothetical protein [Actinomycetota bacterium]
MFVFTRWWSFFGAAVVLGGVLLIAHGLIVSTQRAGHRRQRGVKALVIGADGRASTSKLQVLMWTIAVLYAFTFLLLWGRSIGCDRAAEKPVCAQAGEVRGLFGEILEEPLETEYYALLGLPTAAAVAAKALTVNKVAKGDVVKQSVPRDEAGGVGKALAEIVSADNGRTDLIDFQYFAFNLLALAYFMLQFVASPAEGLPEIPPTLIALTGVAVAAYTGKKALESDAPTITAVLPRRLTIGEAATLTVIGTGFGRGAGSGERLAIDGVEVPVASGAWTDRKIEGDLEPETLDRLRVRGRARAADVTVVTAEDAVSRPYRVEIERRASP